MVELRSLDRCGDNAETTLDSFAGTTPLPAPALSADGRFSVWATGTEVRRYDNTATAVPPVPDMIIGAAAGDVIGPNVDVSADGSTVVFEAGLPGTVRVWTAETATTPPEPPQPATNVLLGAAGSSWPTMAGDGTIVVYQAEGPVLPGAPETGPYLVLADMATEPPTQRILTTSATRPDLSSDATFLAYDAAGAVRVRRSDTTVPFDGSTERVASAGLADGTSVGESVSGAVVSGDGALVVFDSPRGVDLSADAAFAVDAHVWARASSSIFEPIPAPTTTTTTTSTTTTTTTSTTTTTTPIVTRIPATTAPRATTATTAPRATTTTTVPLPAVFEPATFDFAPTIVLDGRRTAVVELVNPALSTVTVENIRVEPAEASGFTVDSSTCFGALPAVSRCVVSITFNPLTVGQSTATLIADLDDGTLASAALSGLGAPPPTLSVLPSVASNGQVVTVFGSGFPAGAVVDFSWDDGRQRGEITIDDAGGFSQPLVVLPNTTAGPVEMNIAGQPDLFGDVGASMLVTASSSRSDTAVLGSAIAVGG